MATIHAFLPGRIIGTNANDEIHGSHGNDVIFAGYGQDIIYAGFGNDVISGHPLKYDAQYDEDDTVSYSYATTGATIDLKNGFGSTSPTQRDTLIEIDNATGTNYNDVIFGDDTSNVLRGLGGNDVIFGGRGPDIMDGGEGIDWLSFYGDATHLEFGGVLVRMSSGKATSPGENEILAFGMEDTFSGFENVRGTRSGDDLSGDSYSNVLAGMEGNDELWGNEGADTLDGGEGNDLIYGGWHNDTIAGGFGDDTLSGGMHADVFVFGIQRGPSSGHDTISDFSLLEGDRIRFDVSNPAGGMSELTIRQVGSNTVISYDDTAGSLTLEGVSAGSLSNGLAFEFV